MALRLFLYIFRKCDILKNVSCGIKNKENTKLLKKGPT